MDPISDMLSAIKNAGDAGRDNIEISYSKIKENIANILKTEGFVKDVKKKTKGSRPLLSVDLLIENRVPKVRGIKRISKPSRRVYTKVGALRGVRRGYGVLILSTPDGVMSGRMAKKAGVGGEALFSIW